MSILLYPVDKESILNLQRLYDAFIHDKEGNVYLKNLSPEFRDFQRSDYKYEVFDLYDELFEICTPEELQKIVCKTNKLMFKLISIFGSFDLDPGFIKVDRLDKILLYDRIDDISQPDIPHSPLDYI